MKTTKFFGKTQDSARDQKHVGRAGMPALGRILLPSKPWSMTPTRLVKHLRYLREPLKT